MTDQNETLKARRLEINLGAFAVAFICAPLVVTGLTTWFSVIPLYALLLGGPVYVIVGLPVLIWYLRRYPPHYLPLILLALIAQLVLVPVMLIAALIYGDMNMMEALPALLLMGALFGGAWTAVFTLIYRTMTRAPRP